MRAWDISRGFRTHGRVVSFNLAQRLANALKFRDSARIRLRRRVCPQGHVSLRRAG
jgi:hypothetical protein